MAKTNLTKVEELAKKLETMEKVVKELKKVQSQKCRLKKQKGKSSYQEEMEEILRREQLLKEVRQLMNPREKPVTMYTEEDVKKLEYDEVVKAIRSIQSKKTLSRWLTVEEGNNPEYKKAVQIEEMLKKRRDEVRPVEKNQVRKKEVQKIIETIEDSGKLSQDKIVELLKTLV